MKIKRKRYRVHHSVQTTTAHAGGCATAADVEKGPPTNPQPVAGGVVPLSEDIMKCKAVVSLETDTESESWQKKKRDKMKLKREEWLQKIELSKKQKQEEKAAEERKKTVVVGDMKPLATSLPVIAAGEEGRMEIKKAKQQTRTMLSEICHYHDVLKHPAFKQDPMGTILEHVQNSVATGAV